MSNYRDVSDVKTIGQLGIACLILAILLGLSLIANAFMYLRRPDRIIVDKSSGRVEMINDREYGQSNAVTMTPDRPGKDDKAYVAKQFAESLYKIDPQTRPADVERALKMMVPGSAAKFGAYLKDSKVLDTQRAESWQSTWEVTDIQVDQADPYLVRLDGRQRITKLINKVAQEEVKTLKLQIKLVADPKGRADENQRTGYLVQGYDYKEIN